MDDNSLIHHSKKWDRTGVLVSALCLAHCLAFPIFIALLPATHAYLSNPLVEAALLMSAILVGSVSFITSYKTHKKIGPLTLGALGIGIMCIGLLVGSSHSHLEPTNSLDHINFPMIFGGLFLISGHLWNIYACHCFCDNACSHEEHQH